MPIGVCVRVCGYAIATDCHANQEEAKQVMLTMLSPFVGATVIRATFIDISA